tara:strand:+ start:1319 stop:3736 length:2418 start_codon:yes stop_codon:yes gene_type:complete
MADTKLISPGIPNYTLKRNLRLNDKYISNDGGNEGITVDDAGDVGINIPTTITPSTQLEVFNSNVQYSTGTAIQSTTAIVGSGTTFTIAMVGGRFVFDDGTDAGIITGFTNTSVLIVSTSQTVGSSPSDFRAYKIYYPSVQIDTGASSTSLKIGNTSFDTSSGDISLAANGGGNIMMTDGTNNIFDFDVDSSTLHIYSDEDTGDYLQILVGDNGASSIMTNDDEGASASLLLQADGIITLKGTYLSCQPFIRTSSGSDVSFSVSETLNLGSGEAGGSDVHYGVKYSQTQTDIGGWDDVYLMHISGGDAARTFAIRDDGKVGIGVTDPDATLEVLSTGAQLKLSYDADDYFRIAVGADGHTTMLNNSGAAGDINIEAKDDLHLKADVVSFTHASDATAGYLRMDVAAGQLDIQNGAGNAVILLDDGDRNLYFYDKGGEYINSDGTDLSIVSGGDITLTPGGDTLIDRNTALTATATAKGLHIDYDHTGISASGQTITGIGLDLDMNCESVTHVGTVDQTGIDIDMVAATAGHQGNIGIDVACSGSDTCTGITIDTTVASSGNCAGIYIDNKNGGTDFKNVSSADATDYFLINTIAAGATTLSTVDTTVGATAHLTLEADGSIILNSPAGGFEMHGGGTTAKFADMYAGMILGYTVIGLDASPATFDVTNAMLPVHDDLKVSFVFPPSGKVEILSSIHVQTDAQRAVTFGLSTTDASTGFATLGAEYENHAMFADETDGVQHTHRWYVTGTAGDSEELWFSAGTTQAGRIDLFWGGDSSSVADSSHPMEYQPFVMKATALPSTVYVG